MRPKRISSTRVCFGRHGYYPVVMGLLKQAVANGVMGWSRRKAENSWATLVLIPCDPEWNMTQMMDCSSASRKVTWEEVCKALVKGYHAAVGTTAQKSTSGYQWVADGYAAARDGGYNVCKFCGDGAYDGGRYVMMKCQAAGSCALDAATCVRDGGSLTWWWLRRCVSEQCKAAGTGLLEAAAWAGKRLVYTSLGIMAVGAIALVGYGLWKWHWNIDARCRRRLRECGPSMIAFMDKHDGGPCLYCRKATMMRPSKGLRQFRTPMMRCWGCMYKPAFQDIWLHGGSFDRAAAVINRHRVKGDWTAGSELQATHGKVLREIPTTMAAGVQHSEVILMVAALNATTGFVDDYDCADHDDIGDAQLLARADARPPPENANEEPEPADAVSDDEGGGGDTDAHARGGVTERPRGNGSGSASTAPDDYADARRDAPPCPNPFAIRTPLRRTDTVTGPTGVYAWSQPPRTDLTQGYSDDYAEPEPAFLDAMPVPFGTLGQGYASVAEVKSLPAYVHLTPADHPGAGKERQVAQQACELEQYNAVKDTSSLIGASLLLHERATNPQFMVIGSKVAERELPYVAGSGPDIERAAIANRHFAIKANKYGGITGVVQEHARPAILGACERVLKLIQAAGRCANELQSFPEGYDVNPRDASDSLHKKSTLLKDFEYFAFTPSSWSTDRGKTGFSKLANTEEDYRQKHTFFVKLNEALKKVKPRLIQASGDGGCAVHTFDAGFFETILFGISILERRSVKHAGPEHLRARLSGLLKPYMTGYAGSFDYGAFDSSNCQHKDDPRHAMKELIENAILKALFGEDAKTSDITRQALEDRCRKFLRSRSAFWLLYTKTYGRESGDRGTSCLNFLVNLVLWLAMMGMESAYRKNCEKHPSAKEPLNSETSGPHSEWVNAWVQGMEFDGDVVDRWLKGEPCGFDLVAEGDDGLWLFTKKFAEASPGGVSAMADRFDYWSCMQGTNLEPQDENGEATGANRLQLVARRMEHCSKIIVPYWTETTVVQKKSGGKRDAKEQEKKRVLRVALLPKMRKTIEAADITFGLDSGTALSESTKDNIAFTKFASCAFNCIDDPLMFNYFFMHARVKLQGDGDPELKSSGNTGVRFEYSAKNYVHKNMAADMCGRTKTIDEDKMTELSIGPHKLLLMLRQRHERAISVAGHCEAMRRAVQIESPRMDDEFIVAAIAGMQATGTWAGCGEWAGLVKARLGSV